MPPFYRYYEGPFYPNLKVDIPGRGLVPRPKYHEVVSRALEGRCRERDIYWNIGLGAWVYVDLPEGSTIYPKESMFDLLLRPMQNQVTIE